MAEGIGIKKCKCPKIAQLMCAPNHNSDKMTSTKLSKRMDGENQCLFVRNFLSKLMSPWRNAIQKAHTSINKNQRRRKKNNNIYWCKHTVEQIAKRDDKKRESGRAMDHSILDSTNRWSNNQRSGWIGQIQKRWQTKCQQTVHEKYTRRPHNKHTSIHTRTHQLYLMVSF